MMTKEMFDGMFDGNTWKVLAASTAGVMSGGLKNLHGLEHIAVSLIPIVTLVYLILKLIFLIKNKGEK